MIYPAIHHNGTSQERLLADVIEAREKLHDAIQAFNKTYPHGRDYYPQGDKVIYDAERREWRDRRDRLCSVYAELLQLATFISFGKGE